MGGVIIRIRGIIVLKLEWALLEGGCKAWLAMEAVAMEETEAGRRRRVVFLGRGLGSYV